MSHEQERPAIAIPKSLQNMQYQTQPEQLQVRPQPNKLYIGIPIESTLQENRVALVPASVATLAAYGHRIIVEAGAGEKAHFSDHDYSEAGAVISFSKEEVFRADVLIKVAPPTLEEIELMHPSQILISPLQLPLINADYINRLLQKRVIALAMEYIKDDSDMFPVVRIMSEMAGLSAMLTAAELLSSTGGGKGVLLGGISGVPSAKVVILGAGIVGEHATRVALGLGAEVRVFDNDIYKLKRLQNQVGRQLFTSVFNPYYLEEELVNAEVAIGAIHAKSGRAPLVVSEEMVAKMKPGSVIVDLAAGKGANGVGGNCPLTEADQTVIKHGVTLVGDTNLPALVAADASALYARNVLDFLKLVLPKDKGFTVDMEDDIVAACLMTQGGEVKRK